MCASVVDIQSATAEIGEERKKRRKKNKRQDENIYGVPYYIGQPQETTGLKYNVRICYAGWP